MEATITREDLVTLLAGLPRPHGISNDEKSIKFIVSIDRAKGEKNANKVLDQIKKEIGKVMRSQDIGDCPAEELVGHGGHKALVGFYIHKSKANKEVFNLLISVLYL